MVVGQDKLIWFLGYDEVCRLTMVFGFFVGYRTKQNGFNGRIIPHGQPES
jgi:hypothetical protein